MKSALTRAAHAEAAAALGFVQTVLIVNFFVTKFCELQLCIYDSAIRFLRFLASLVKNKK